ncbi:MAG: hypothetical protein ACRCWI_05000 [Brevinema sp.]
MRKIIISLLIFIVNCSVSKPGTPLGVGSTPKFEALVPTSDYVIYYDNATLPTLYMSLHMQTHTKESYLYMGRPTIDSQKLPSHVQLIAPIGDVTSGDQEMRKKITELNQVNPNATFTLYINENRFGRVFNYFYRQGIAKDRVKIVQMTDGTFTYTSWKNHFSSSTGYAKWQELEKDFIREYNQDSTVQVDAEGLFADKGKNYAPVTLKKEYTYWLQWPELLVSDSTDLKNYLNHNSSRYYKVDPLAYYQSLNQAQQQNIIRLMGLDKKWAMNEGDGTLDDQTIGEVLDASPKPNIIVTGTNPYGNTTDNLIKKVKAQYGDGYDYFFKGHPADRTKPLDTSITVLPFQLPMEAIIWVYGNNIQVLGGYQSSLYMNAPKTMKKFFFVSSASGITIAPLDLMYQQGLLGEVEFIN